MTRPTRLLALAAVIAMIAAGCWAQSGWSGGRTGANPIENTITAASVAGLTSAWSSSVTGRAHEAIADNGVVYVGGADSVRAFDLATGAIRWTAPSLPGVSTPALAGGKLWAPTGSGTCRLTQLDPATGGVLGSQPTQTFPDLNGTSGAFSACGTSATLFVAGRVYVPASYVGTAPSPGCGSQLAYGIETAITALSLDGGPGGWFHNQTTTGCGIPSVIPPGFGELTAVGPYVIAPSRLALGPGTRITAYRATDCGRVGPACVPAWGVDLGMGVISPVTTLANGDLAVATTNGRVTVLDSTNGATRWSATLGSSLTLPLAASSSTIFAAAPDGTFSALPAAGCGAPACSATWTATTASPASARPSIGGNVVYVGSADGSVTAFAANGCGTPTCSSLWSASTGSQITGAPTIVAGHVFVGSNNGTVTAYALP